ncbi:MAG: hypothetical protein E7527_06680 [Ruminococcaceae bacterium]|nr:hypothetical protein [Oscillospiraceae bacterium]
MNLKGKKLLLMGGGAYAKGIKKYADQQGFYMVGVGASANTPIRDIADEFYQINTQDVDAVSQLVVEKGIDGIFVGSSEVNICPAITVSERTGCHFYVNREQWDILANKARFKDYCRQYGVPVVPEYSLPANYTQADVENLPFPVLLKPTDSSGARGMNVCTNTQDFDRLYQDALSWSKRKEVIIEELITEADEVFFQYTIQDGVCSLTSCFTKAFVHGNRPDLILPIFHMYPSKYLDEYYAQVHDSVVKLFKSLGVHSGVMTLQSFYKDGRFYIFEAGFRMGGAQNYILTEHQWGVNSLEYMINYALTGSMADYSIAQRDNAYFRWPCCNYYISLMPGTITEVHGLAQVEAMENVLNVTKMYELGDVIQDTNALERVCLRLHVYGKTAEELAEALVKISATLQILDQDGNEMQIEHLEYDRCLKAIQDGCLLEDKPYAGKRLLILGGTVASYDLVKLAKEMGVYTIVTDDRQTGAAKDIADEKVLISTADIDALVQYVRDNHIDGVFCSPSEFNIRNAIQLCQQTGLPFYTSQEQWDACNNKRNFKQHCLNNGLPYITDHFHEGDDKAIVCSDCQFPVIVKPVDGSGSQGVSVCHSTAELSMAIDKALPYSRSGKIIIEKYLDNGGRLFSFRYLLNNGECYPYLLMDTYIADPENKQYLISAFSMAPSEHIDAFMEKADGKIRATIQEMGLKYGTVFAQTIPYADDFYCHDMGYRLSGGITYHLSEALTGINDMKMMLRYALGGPLATEEELSHIDLTPSGKYAGQLMVPLMAGTIASIEGIEHLKDDPAVLSYIQYYNVGETIREKDLGNLGQQFARIYILASSKEELVSHVNRIQDAISIKDTEGNEMFTLRFDTNRLYQ